MSRTFRPISIPELKAKINDLGSLNDILNTLKSDIKVEFDTENYNMGENSRFDEKDKAIFGYHTLDNGLTFLGIAAGGDWEYPVFFIVYWDGKKCRGYVPTEGNPWNTKTKRAYGNDEGADFANARQRYPDRYDEEDSEFDVSDCDYDCAAIINDIKARIVNKDKDARESLEAKIVKKRKELEKLEEELNALEKEGLECETRQRNQNQNRQGE